MTLHESMPTMLEIAIILFLEEFTSCSLDKIPQSSIKSVIQSIDHKPYKPTQVNCARVLIRFDFFGFIPYPCRFIFSKRGQN